ncbi:tetratricopeptide repeat protein, partial [Amycolatopsis kentuckyensis]|uniref:tetratricopeptide repeat protein n=1 Tax=Amycolatopsis kentuckyensis TaxID=218823 RepID=UPI0035621BC3
MRREVEVYSDWPGHPPEQGRWTCGSGYLLAGRLVLTAAHVVCRASQALSSVRIRAESGGLVAARVMWHRWESTIDAALLEITDSAWVPPQWRHSVRWGRFVTRSPGQECEAIGFPKVVATPQMRDSHHAVGTLNPGTLVKSGLYAMEVTNPPSFVGADGSAWAGMSGAALRCGDRAGVLVGVVTQDPSGFDNRRLIIMPISAVASDVGFAKIVADHTGRPPLVEAVELAELAEPVSTPASPAELLRADAATVPFRPRPEFDELRDWCEADAWAGTRLVAGAGGQGKTRLARHLASSLTSRGWATVMLGEHARAEDLAVLAHVVAPTLVVVDYAEGRATQLDPLVDALNRAEAKVRLLLLARTAGAWRTERVTPASHLSILADDRIVVNLRPVEPDRDGRQLAWREAIDALANRLATLDGYQAIAWPNVVSRLALPPLDDDRFRTILAVQMHALAALLHADDPIPVLTGTPVDAQEVLLEHEARYWSRIAERFGISLAPATRRSLVAAATLWGASTGEEARKIVATSLTHASDDQITNIADWLATLYRDGERYWSGLQPDILGEYLVGTALSEGEQNPGLVTATLAAASTGQLEQALTVLGRAHPQHPRLTAVLTRVVLNSGVAGARAAVTVAPRLAQPRPLLAALDRFVHGAELSQLYELQIALPRLSLLLGPTTVTAAAQLTRLLRSAIDAERDAYLPALARSINNLAVRLGEVGRRPEALAAAQEAVEFYRELVKGNRDAYLPDLAMSINNLAVQLAEAGRRPEALTAGQEAVALRRELVKGNRDAYLPNLATSISNLANRLAEAGRRPEALTAGQEAVALRRELVKGNRDAYLPDLATSINNLANRLGEVGRRPEALTAAQEAVALRRELVEGNRDAYLPALAMSISNLAVRLAEAGRRPEALAAAQEAVEFYRELLEGNRDAYLPNLAGSINNLAVRLAEAGRRPEALAAAQEAVEFYRELLEGNRDAYLP